MKGYSFNAEKATRDIIKWIRVYFEENGKECNAVIGISGGKDSSVAAALLVKALGKERVVGVLMPQGEQHDIDYSKELCDLLGIRNVEVNIASIMDCMNNSLNYGLEMLETDTTTVTTFNTPARVRMTVLYGIAGSVKGRVCNTCNLSEDWVGYATKFGDGAGDFSPLMELTVTEVKAIGRELKLPEKFIEKTPIDGLCGKTDEDNLGFTYEVLDKYLREGICEDLDTKEKIDRMHKYSLHKLEPMPRFEA